MQVLAIIHAPFEGLGSIKPWLVQHHHQLTEVHSYRGDDLPSINEFDCLIIMGGPQDLKNIEKYDYLSKEILFIQNAIKRNKSILGICLGAQLIAESLGAKTQASPQKEIGIFPVQLLNQASSDSVVKHFPYQFMSAHWHNDMPGLPSDAVVLAESRGCPRQIVRFQPHVYGLQCHLELTLENVQEMLAHEEGEFPEGPFVQSREELLGYPYDSINQYMDLFLKNFISII